MFVYMKPVKITSYELRGKTCWVLDLRGIGKGRRYYPTRAEAEADAAVFELDIKNHGLEAFNLTGRQRVEYQMAEERLSVVNATITQAVEYYLANYKTKDSPPIGQAIEICCDDKESKGLRKRYIRQLRYSCRSFGSLYPQKRVNQIRPADVDAWLTNPDWALRTKQGYLIDLATFFNYAIRRGWTQENPCHGVEAVVTESTEIQILSVGDAKRIAETALKVCPAAVPYFALALFCGVRSDEIKRLTWDDLQNGHVRVTAQKSKTRQRRLVTISDNCRAWLALGGDVPPVGWQERFEKVIAAAGYNKTNPWPRNAMRHSFVSYALPIRGIKQTALEAGHSEAMLFQHYRELVTQAEAEAFWKIFPPKGAPKYTPDQSPKARSSEAARKAAAARWKNPIPQKPQ